MVQRVSMLAALAAVLGGCAQEYQVIGLVGNDGSLRFNLQFTNELEVDLDLHVVTPGSEEISWLEESDSTGGSLDVDCLCDDCPNGANENIFWPYEITAPAGTYAVTVEYYGPCELFAMPMPTSDYTLRVMAGGDVIETYTGTLGDFETASYTYAYTP